ncbi:hypothetical protein PIIN_08719 [Serendipita indica DSM 11827]|uniref:Cyclin N-terminal domain-containing protein n=1 Tax=Serendipita indica (strain DSM 11827) TaxID=1109443 RepID=G4TTW8_SERID|nr:hypothetical protein PIIN_08719 [Serendipita indica DSM 11827]
MSVVGSPLLDRVLKLKVNQHIIHYVVTYLCTLVKIPPVKLPQHGMQNTSSLGINDEFDDFLPDLDDFIQNISTRSRCTMSTILVTLIYLRRLTTILEFSSTPYARSASSRHCVVFSAIMIAHKIWNDSTMIGKHWAEVSDLFDPVQVANMEREFLALLRFELQVSNQEIWEFARPFMCAPYLRITPREQAWLDAQDAANRPLSFQVPPPAKTSPVTQSIQYKPSFSPSLVDAIPLHDLERDEAKPGLYATEACHPYSRIDPITPLSATSLSSFESESVSPPSTYDSPVLPRMAQVPGSARVSSQRSSSTKTSSLAKRSKSGPHVLSPSARLKKKRQIDVQTAYLAPLSIRSHPSCSEFHNGASNGMLLPSSISVSTSNSGTTWLFNGPFTVYS